MSTPFFDRSQELKTYDGDRLPHWNQEEKIQFITFRLSDSLPQKSIQEIKQLISTFERNNPKPWDTTTQIRFKNQIAKSQSKLLDNGYGACILKDPAIRQHLINTIEYFDGTRFNVIAYVIMPNHVHLLIQLLPAQDISQIIHSLKSYSSKLINRHLSRKGSIWMKRYYDTIVRNEDHLKHYINYIINNPRHLPSSHYTLYRSP